jgi:hypothetical protein
VDIQWVIARRRHLAQQAARDAEFNESDHPRDDDGKFGSGSGGGENIKSEPENIKSDGTYKKLSTEKISPSKIEPVNEVQDKEKLKQLVSSMKKEGWKGRPIAVLSYGDQYQALTGSHRIFAARKAGIKVPVVVIPDRAAIGNRNLAAGVIDPNSIAETVRKNGRSDLADLIEEDVEWY